VEVRVKKDDGALKDRMGGLGQRVDPTGAHRLEQQAVGFVDAGRGRFHGEAPFLSQVSRQ